MFAVVVALVAQDWSALDGRRAPTPDELREVRARLVEWTARTPIPELQVGQSLEIVRGERVPHVRIEAVSVNEERRVEEVVKPYPREGPLPHRRVTDVDPWNIAVPVPSGEKKFVSHERRVPVDGSEEVRTCATCRGMFVAACSTCGGKPQTCRSCLGSRRMNCHACRSRVDPTCRWCNGSRHTACISCAGTGTCTCSTCLGHGMSTCGTCGGTGRVVASLVIVVTATAHREERKVWDGDAWWSRMVPFGDAWTAEAEGAAIDAAVESVPDPWINRALAEAVRASRAAARREAACRVRVLRVPVTWVAYRHEGRDYELVLTPHGVVAMETPMTRWARSRAAEGDAFAARREWEAAHHAYRRALAADPGCGAARRGLATVARETAASWQSTAMWVLAPLAGAIACTMAGLKLYLRRRASRAAEL